jgi:protein gp37
MSAGTSIEWTEATWNPVRGCAILSPGCTNCYAMKIAHRFSGPGKAYAGLTKLTKGGPVWTGKVRTVPEAIGEPLRWQQPRRIFVNSMSDLFHKDVPDSFIARVWWVMGQCAGFLDPSRRRGHVFQILTKRPDRALSWLNGWTDLDTRREWIENLYGRGRGEVFDWMSGPKYWPDVLPNVWLGVSVEDQHRADERIPLLLQTPAAVRWISAEPLLGEITFVGRWVEYRDPRIHENWLERLDWVVIGGESGQGHRQMDMEHARSLIAQCQAVETRVFVKQDSGPRPGMQGRFTAEEWAIKQYPKRIPQKEQS